MDKNAKDLVNSYRFGKKEYNRFKEWSPDISKEERYKKKRYREDNYIANFKPEDRPILLIENK